MNTKKVKNPGLETQVASSGVIQIYELNTVNLEELGFIDEYGWPSGDFVQVLKDLDTISPLDFDHNVKFWDQVDRGGYSLYNKFLENIEE